MNEKRLACCIVRDLLPSYIEDLTEAETAAMVKEHIDNCSDCYRIEQDMRHTIPVERSPKQELRFLRRIKRTRLIAAALSCIIALWCMWWLYDQEFHYPNTEAGRLAAVEDYIPMSNNSSIPHGVRAGTPLSVGGWKTENNHLFIFYFADNAENVHGIVHLVRGLNGKYRILEADESPSDYSGGIFGDGLNPKGTDWDLYYLAGYNCRDIYQAEVEFIGFCYDGIKRYSVVRTFELSGRDFLELIDREALENELGLEGKELVGLHVKNVKFFNKKGDDITSDYTNDPLPNSWGSGKTKAETFLLYVYIGIVALFGIGFIRYFLHRD